MTIILDNIIYSLQKKGGVSSYWSELRNRIYNFENINIIELGPKKHKFHFLNKIILLLFEKYSRIELNNITDNCVFHSSYYRALYTSSKKNNIKQIVTVHDFTYELFSSGLKKIIHVWQKKRAIKNADVIICVSENTKNDLIRLYPQFSTKKIKIIYHGVSSDYFKLNNQTSISDYFLFVGSREKYKNFHKAVENISKIPNVSLIIVGKKLNSNEIYFLNHHLPKRWSIRVNLENSELNILYNNAFALFYPSSYEGFGIPLLEAMAAGCPFIALNKSSIPEVSGSAGVLLNDLSFEEFEKAVNKIKFKREEIINEGFKQISKFSWQDSINETFKIYKEVFSYV